MMQQNITSTLYARSFINGEWVDGEGDVVGRISPVNGELIGSYRKSSLRQADLAIRSAKEAQKKWKEVPLLDKLDLLKKA